MGIVCILDGAVAIVSMRKNKGFRCSWSPPEKRNGVPFLLLVRIKKADHYKHPQWTRIADKVGVSTRTARNWTREFADRLDAQGITPSAYREILGLLAAMLGLGGAAGGALARRVAALPEMPEPLAFPEPAAGPFEFAMLDGRPVSPPPA